MELTALGAAYLAGLAIGFWTLDDLCSNNLLEKTFQGTYTASNIEGHKQKWGKAIARAKNWLD